MKQDRGILAIDLECLQSCDQRREVQKPNATTILIKNEPGLQTIFSYHERRRNEAETRFALALRLRYVRISKSEGKGRSRSSYFDLRFYLHAQLPQIIVSVQGVKIDLFTSMTFRSPLKWSSKHPTRVFEFLQF